MLFLGQAAQVCIGGPYQAGFDPSGSQRVQAPAQLVGAGPWVSFDGFSLAGSSEHLLDTAVVYAELGKGGTCNFGEVFTTDGRVASLKLNVVQDDKKFFPIYSPALSVRSDVAKKYPGLEGPFKPIANKLSTETLLALNKEVSVDGQKPRAVAEAWMRSQGFIK